LKELKRTIVIISGNPSFNYLIQRYADRIGIPTTEVIPLESAETIVRLKPVAVIFPSVENLEGSQPLVTELTNADIPIIVCSSTADQNRTRELGADYCLLHPLDFDRFSAILEAVTSQGIRQSEDVGRQV